MTNSQRKFVLGTVTSSLHGEQSAALDSSSFIWGAFLHLQKAYMKYHRSFPFSSACVSISII